MHDKLLQKVEEALKMASDLSTHERDIYAACVEYLMITRDTLKRVSKDRSAECKCECHVGSECGPAMHFKECECYSGRPYLD